MMFKKIITEKKENLNERRQKTVFADDTRTNK